LHLLIILTILTSLPSTARAENAPVRSLTMTPGDSMTVNWQPGTDVKVSRKGIVDVFPLSESSWQLTALRGGLVVIDGYDQSGQPQLPRLFIDVKGPSSPDRPPVAVGLPDWICRQPGISCSGESGVVSGAARDFRWYLRAAAWCTSTRNCTLFVETAGDVRSALKQYISDRLSGYEVTVSATGQIAATAPCDSMTVEQHGRVIESALPRLLEDRVLSFRCAGDHDTYRMTIKARKVSDSDGETTGYQGEVNHQLSSPPSFSRWSAEARLRADATSAKQETIGAPHFLVTGGTEFQALIGGELPYLTDREGGADTYQWKEYGLSVKGTITGRTGNSSDGSVVRGNFEVFLKSINDQSTGGLLTSSLKTRARIPTGVWQLLGELDLTSDLNRERFVPGLASIPLIGPLFRLKSAASSRSRLQIWTMIEPQP
jgi:hypothetical protein